MMIRVRSFAAIFLSGLMAASGSAQTVQQITGDQAAGFVERLTYDYRPHPMTAPTFVDSSRLENLLRAGSIYLSLRDAIALALENNLDLENARVNPKLQDANLLRAKAGRLLRNVNTNISSGPSSANLGALGGVNAVGSSASASNNSGSSNILSGLNVQLAGSDIPNLDPTVFVNGGYQHQTQIQTNTVATGTNSLTSDYKTFNYGIQQGFLTGTSVQLASVNTFSFSQNSPNNQFNPFTTANLQFAVQQNLLQGFRRSVNNRAIRVAKNQLRITDLGFKQQVIATVTSVVNLYWDLVSFREALRVKQQALELNTKLYEDNKRRAELGAIAPIDIIQAEAEMKNAQLDVTAQQNQVLQQEMILKSVLTRSGVDSLELATASIIPTDHFEVPALEAVRPVQDLIGEAFQNRPEIEQNRIALLDSEINMLGTKNALLPTLSVYGTAQNSGLSGAVNTLPVPLRDPATGNIIGSVTRTEADVTGLLLGGYGNVLSQVFSRKFPNYSVGFNLNIPLKNRAAQADLITDQLNYRQQQIQDKQFQNNIKLGVMRARTDLAQARAAYDTSVEARKLQDQTLTGTRRKYELGTATILDVVVTQRDATTRELNEVNALNQYMHAKTNLDNVLGEILNVHDVNIEEAQNGAVKRQPDLIPPIGKR
jgi:outer membrane protein TolC